MILQCSDQSLTTPSELVALMGFTVRAIVLRPFALLTTITFQLIDY